MNRIGMVEYLSPHLAPPAVGKLPSSPLEGESPPNGPRPCVYQLEMADFVEQRSS